MATTSDTTTLPVDIATMRDTVNRLLDPDSAPDALPPAGEELENLTAILRGHLQLLAPEVEAAARNLSEGSTHRYTVLGCVWEARSRLEAQPSRRNGGPTGHARRLARVLDALCDHYERLGSSPREASEQTALRRLGEHCVTCPTCRTADDAGMNLGISCETGDALAENYRHTLRDRRTRR